MKVYLKVAKGKSSGREIKIPASGFRVGRSPDCHLRPKSDSISRRHCEIEIDGDNVVVRDLGSKNGTYVNGTKVEGDQALANGDLLRIGRIDFEVVLVKAIAPVETVKEDSSLEDDVSSWLEEGDTTERLGRRDDPTTRQIRLEELTPSTDEAADAAEDETESKSGEKKKKKEYGKLPDRKGSDSANSRDAAADMLKKFFNRT